MAGRCATVRAPSGRYWRLRRDARALLVLFTALFVTAAARAENPPAAGLYDIESYMLMPHLDEIRRLTKSEQRCVGDGDVTSLFPVLRQAAFRGCVLLARASDEGEYA